MDGSSIVVKWHKDWGCMFLGDNDYELIRAIDAAIAQAVAAERENLSTMVRQLIVDIPEEHNDFDNGRRSALKHVLEVMPHSEREVECDPGSDVRWTRWIRPQDKRDGLLHYQEAVIECCQCGAEHVMQYKVDHDDDGHYAIIRARRTHEIS